MDGITLETDNEVETPELSTEHYARINDFKESLETDGVVSKNDVLSLEEFLGINLVTSKIPANRLTSLPSITRYDDVLELVTHHAMGYKPVTNLELLTAAKTLAYRLRELRYRLVELASPANKEFLNRATSKELSYSIVEDKVVDVLDMDIIRVCTGQWHYLSSIKDERRAEALMDLFSNNEDVLHTGLMLLTAKNGVEGVYYRPRVDSVTEVTLRSVIDATVSGSVIPELDELIKHINRDIDAIMKGRSWDTDEGSELATAYKRYNSIKDTLTDVKTTAVLAFLSNTDN